MLVNLQAEQNENAHIQFLETYCLKHKNAKMIWAGDIIGFTGVAYVEFGSDWEGLDNANKFEETLTACQRGKEHWLGEGKRKTGIYGWIACASDFYRTCPVGYQLHRIGRLTTISSRKDEEQLYMLKVHTSLDRGSSSRIL